MKRILAITLLSWIMFGCSSDDRSTNTTHLPSSWSSAQVVSLCNARKPQGVDQNLVRTNERKTYFNRKVSRSSHEIHVSFAFISECCREFDIEYALEEHRLIILYKPKYGELCECKCDYQGIVTIGDTQINFNEIRRVIIKKGFE